jgi:hypothetical protein
MTGFYRFMVHNFPAATYLPEAPCPGIFSTEKLNCRVRDGNGWVLLVIATENLYSLRALFIAPSKLHNTSFFLQRRPWSSPRPISTGPLNALLRLHSRPINHVVFMGPYFLYGMGRLISGRASRLDAFSVYPFRTWLPGRASGDTTGSPLVRPSRSSRTRDSPPQTSCAHDR